MLKQSLDSRQINTLANACRVAAERFGDHAKEFRDGAAKYAAMTEEQRAAQANAAIHPSALERLAVQFEGQQTETLELLDWIEGNDLDQDEDQFVQTISRHLDR